MWERKYVKLSIISGKKTLFFKANRFLPEKPLLVRAPFFLTYFIFFFGFKDSRVNFLNQSVSLSQGLSQLL